MHGIHGARGSEVNVANVKGKGPGKGPGMVPMPTPQAFEEHHPRFTAVMEPQVSPVVERSEYIEAGYGTMTPDAKPADVNAGEQSGGRERMPFFREVSYIKNTEG